MWFFYALAFAIMSSFSVTIAKKVMRSVDQYTYLLISGVFTAPFLLVIALTFFPIPAIDRTFWSVTIVGTVVSAAGSLMAFKAIKESEISLVNPISAFNPVFTAIISFFTLKEAISIKGAIGIVTIVVGAYILNISTSKRGIFEPIKSLATNRWVQLSLFAYLIWAVTPTFEKTAILHTFPQNPSFAAFVGQLIVIFIYFPLVIKLSEDPIEKIKLNIKWFLLAGILGGVGITFAFLAFASSPLGIATGVFKLSLIFVPILGYLFFKEHDIKERLLGSAVMLLGVALLVT